MCQVDCKGATALLYLEVILVDTKGGIERLGDSDGLGDASRLIADDDDGLAGLIGLVSGHLQFNDAGRCPPGPSPAGCTRYPVAAVGNLHIVRNVTLHVDGYRSTVHRSLE